MARDAQRAKVYAAEQFVRTLFDRAAERGNPTLEFFGGSVTLPPEGKFGSVDAVQRYVDDVLSHPAVSAQWPDVAPLAVRSRRGATAAHYEASARAAVIAVPDGRASWALRELVVLHEVAHHVAQSDPPHGSEFVATFTALASAVMGAEVGYVLSVVYAREGVR